MIATSFRPGAAIAFVALLVNMLAAGTACAQVPFRRIATRLDVSEEQVAQQVKESTGPLYGCLPLEVEFVARVCELNAEQVAALTDDGRGAIERLAGEIASVMQKYHRFNRIEIVIRANGEPAVVPRGGGQQTSDSPQFVTRSLLAEAVRLRTRKRGLQREIDAWRDAAEKLAAEEQRLAGFRAQAGALAKVAALDETLWLTRDQRLALRKQFARYANERSVNALLVIAASPKERLYTSLAGGSLTASRLPTIDWQKILSAAQLAAYNEALTPNGVTIVFVREKAAPRQAAVARPQQEPGALPENAQAARRLAAQQMPGGQPRLAKRILRQGPSAEDLMRRLNGYLQQRMDEIDAVCGLTQEQRAKLLMAGKLDLERLRAEFPPPEKLAEGEELVVKRVRIAGDALRLHYSVFDDEGSYFKKALRGRLLADQQQTLAAAEAERRACQRQALVEAMVAGLERAAGLTSHEWRRLSDALNGLWPQDENVRSKSDWREDVTRITSLPEEWWRPFFCEFQWPRARERQAQLANVVREFEMLQQQQAPAAAGGGMF